MQWVATFQDRLSKDEWRYAIAGGLLTVPTAVLLAVFGSSNGGFSLLAIGFGGFVGAFLYGRNRHGSKLVGQRAGLIGSIPALVILIWDLGTWNELPDIVTSLSGISMFSVFVLMAVSLIVTFSYLSGMIGGALGGWFRRKFMRPTAAP